MQHKHWLNFHYIINIIYLTKHPEIYFIHIYLKNFAIVSSKEIPVCWIIYSSLRWCYRNIMECDICVVPLPIRQIRSYSHLTRPLVNCRPMPPSQLHLKEMKCFSKEHIQHFYILLPLIYAYANLSIYSVHRELYQYLPLNFHVRC